MGWSKLEAKEDKPLIWWYHKLMCELGFALRNKFRGISWKLYYKHLNIMCKKYHINLYGRRC